MANQRNTAYPSNVDEHRGLATLLVVVLLSTAPVTDLPAVSALVAAFAIAILGLAASTIGSWPESVSGGAATPWVALLCLVPLLSSLVSGFGPVPETVLDVRPGWLGLSILSCLLIGFGQRRSFTRLAVIGAVLALVSVTAAEVLSDWNAPGGYDVYRIHQSAGDALVSGENPYGEAVQVTSGNPFSPAGAKIVGYPYTPVVLATYGLTAAVTDPRLVSLFAWSAVIGWLASRAMRNQGRSGLSLALLVLAATAPIWPLVWYSGWTEPLSIVLLLGAALLWRRSPIASAILLGLALASKQYFIFLLPMLLFHREEGQLKRALIAGGTVVVTLVPPLLIGAPAFIQATIGNLADIGFRPDAQSLTGLLAEFGIEFHPHPLLWIGLGLAFSTAVALRSRTPSGFFLGSALVLGFSFWIGSAFPNYWFLVMAISAIGLGLRSQESDKLRPGFLATAE